MELSIRPVISCAGHESLVAQLEQQCVTSMSQEPAMWNHSMYRPPYPVRLQACFTRFTADQQQVPVKILYTGRPIRHMVTLEPLIYVFVISNNVTSYTLDGGRNAVGGWLGHLQARNISEWLIIVVNADAQFTASKLWQKSNIAEKIKSDFKLTSHTHHFLQLPDRRAVDEKTFMEAWVTVMRSLRRTILEAYHATIKDYHSHLKLLQESRLNADLDFMDFLDRKEEVAYLHTAVGAYEDALFEYDEAVSILSNFAYLPANGAMGTSWMKTLMSSGKDSDHGILSSLACCPLIRCDTDSPQYARIRDRTASMFDLRTYILARQHALLYLMNRLDEFAPRALDCICSTMQSVRNFGLCSQPLLSCWAVLAAFNSLELMQPPAKATQLATSTQEDVLLSVRSLLATAFGSITHPYDENFEALFPDDDLLMAEERYRPVDNVLLHIDQPSKNPLSLPLAHICHFLYSAMTATVAPIAHLDSRSRLLRQDSLTPGNIYRRRPWQTRNYLVQIWHLAFVHLTLLGQYGHQQNQLLVPALESAELEVDLPGLWTTRLQKQANLLFPTSGEIFTEVLVAMAQIAIGLFRLVDQASNAVTVATVLGGYLQSLQANRFASYFHDSALFVYQRDNWPELTCFAHLQLASCLRSLLKEETPGSKQPAPELLMRYFHSCLTLASASQSCFELMQRHQLAKRPITGGNHRFSDEAAAYQLPYPILPSHCFSPDFWWLEAIALQESIPPDFVWEASWSMSSPFRIDSVKLEGASENGRQLITLDIDVTSETSYYQVYLLVAAQYPTRDDWQAGLHDDLRSNPGANSCNEVPSVPLATIELRPTGGKTKSWSKLAPPPAVSSSHTPVHSTAYVSHSVRPVKATPLQRSTDFDSLVSGESMGGVKGYKKVSNLLGAAAAFATRNNWRSQDFLNSVDLPEKTKELVGDCEYPFLQRRHSQFPGHFTDGYVAQETPEVDSLGPLVNYPVICGRSGDPVRTISVKYFRKFSVNVDASGDDNLENASLPRGRKASVSALTSRRASMLEAGADHYMQVQECRLNQTPPDGNSQPETCYFTAYPSTGNLATSSSSIVLLAPGLNSVQMAASLPGFFIPKVVHVGVIRRAKNVQLASVASRTSKPTQLFKLIYSLQQCQLDPDTWSSEILLNSLLPRLELVTPPGQPVLKSISVILGFRKSFNVDLVLGKLALDPRASLAISVYRRLPSLLPAVPASSNAPKAPNDYNMDIVSIDPGNPKRIVAGSLLEVVSSSNFLASNTGDPVLPPSSRIPLSNPLMLTAVDGQDEFLAYMPLGNFSQLSVEVRRPFMFTLKLYPFRDTHILFYIRIACMDMLEHLATAPFTPQSSFVPTAPTTFRLTNFELKITAPFISPDQIATDRSKSTKSTNKSGAVEKKKQISKKEDSVNIPEVTAFDPLVGIPVDPELVELDLNRLQPVSLLWKFSLTEFRPFVTDVLEKCKSPPLAKLNCLVIRADDPDFQTQLMFERRISPVRPNTSSGKTAMSNIFTRQQAV